MQYEEPSLTVHQVALSEYDAETFISFLRPFSQEISLKRREYIQPTHATVYFVIDGQLEISLQKEDKIIDYAFRYMPVGLPELLFKEFSLNYRAATPVKLLQVPLSKLESIYTQENIHLIRTLITLKSTMLNSLLAIYRERCTGGGYQTIKSLIEHYYNEPRQIEGLGSYILKRTSLSKGYIFSVLSTLKERGVMTMEKGRIIAIHAPLPETL